MVAAWQASGTLLGALTTNDVTPVIPAHQPGDILICQTFNRVTTNTCVTPSGWELLAGPVDQGSIQRSYWFWKRATSSAETNPLCDWTATSADKYAVVHTMRGAAPTGNPFVNPTVTTGTADPGAATGVTSEVGNQRIITVGMGGDNLATAFTSLTGTDPSSYASDNFQAIGTGADANCWFGSALRTAAGATGNLSHDFNGVPLTWATLVASVRDAEPPAERRVRRALFQRLKRRYRIVRDRMLARKPDNTIYPVWRSRDGGNLTTITLNWGSNQEAPRDKDFAVLIWTYGTATPPTGDPSGFNQDDIQEGGGGQHGARLLTRICDGTETPGGSITLTCSSGNRQSATLLVLRGAHQSAPLNDFEFVQEGTTQTTHPAPSITPTAADAVILVAYSERSGTVQDIILPPDFFYTQIESRQSAVGSGGSATNLGADSYSPGRPANVAVSPGSWNGNNSTPNVKIWSLAIAPPAPVSDVTFDGSGPAASSATSDVAVARELAATGPAAAGFTGAAEVARPLAATASAAADFPGALSAARPLESSASASNGAAGALAVTRDIAATAPASAGATGDLTTANQVTLEGSGPATAAATGDATVARDLAATGSASAAATGAAAVDRLLAATAPAASDFPGALSAARPLAASLAAAASADANMALAFTIAGSASAANSASGSLSIGGFEGFITAASSATGRLKTSVLRPSTGTTSRPSTGTTARPFAGITYRP